MNYVPSPWMGATVTQRQKQKKTPPQPYSSSRRLVALSLFVITAGNHCICFDLHTYLHTDIPTYGHTGAYYNDTWILPHVNVFLLLDTYWK